MLSTNLTNQFGKIFANILREFIRLDGIISRDSTYIKAGYMKCCANDKTELSLIGNNLLRSNYNAAADLTADCASNNIELLQEGSTSKKRRDEHCPSSGKLETSLPSSSFKFAKVWTSLDLKILDRLFEPKGTLNNELTAQKRVLNATTGNSSNVQIHETIMNATTARKATSMPKTLTKSFLRAMSTLGARPIAVLPGTLANPTYRLTTRRWHSPKINYRNDCAEWCGEDPCNLNRKDTHLKKSMWLAPDCYNICEKPYRYDIVFMPGSNKETREYQQTWIECPPIRIVKKPVCCFEPKCLPPICRRPRKVQQAVPAKHSTCGVNICRGQIHHPDCEKVREPCCMVKARDPPCCKIYPTPSCCQKRCTPYPSFSECCRPESNRKSPVECLCLIRPTMCEVWADWRKKHLPEQ